MSVNMSQSITTWGTAEGMAKCIISGIIGIAIFSFSGIVLLKKENYKLEIWFGRKDYMLYMVLIVIAVITGRYFAFRYFLFLYAFKQITKEIGDI